MNGHIMHRFVAGRSFSAHLSQSPARLVELGRSPVSWWTVRKRRRVSRFPLTDGSAGARGPGPGEKPGCAVELTEFRALGEDWWTLGFEATGPAEVLRDQLEAAAALVFAQALPGGAELGMDDSMSYAQWLRGQADTGNAPEAGRTWLAAAAWDGPAFTR
jgi:hypothetical protein